MDGRWRDDETLSEHYQRRAKENTQYLYEETAEEQEVRLRKEAEDTQSDDAKIETPT